MWWEERERRRGGADAGKKKSWKKRIRAVVCEGKRNDETAV